MVLPGPEAQQLATYIGWLMHRTGRRGCRDTVCAPFPFILIALSWIYVAYGHLSVVAGLFYGIKPGITAIVVQAAHRIGSRALRNRTQWAIAAAAFVAIFALNVPFPVIVLSAAMMGYVGGRLFPDHFGQGNAHDASRKSYGAAIIDDHTPVAPHTVFKWSRLTLIIIAGVFMGNANGDALSKPWLDAPVYPDGLVLYRRRC